jgi:hypothetical protein
MVLVDQVIEIFGLADLDGRFMMDIYRFEQQAVVGPARIVYAVEVDYARFEKTAKLEKMVPVAPVSCEASARSTAPTSPAHSNATGRLKPSRATMPLAECPRSPSMTSMPRNPHCLASSTRSYCRRLLSMFIWARVWVDCRT